MAITLKEKIGQLFMPAAFVNDTAEGIEEIENLIREHHVGGLTFFHSRAMAVTNYGKKQDVVRNEKSAERLTALIQHYQSISKYPLLMSIDAEWGLAMRLENTEQYPYNLTLGACGDTSLAYKVGEAIGIDLKNCGIHLNLAPVVDINTDPGNPVIGYRSFGHDKKKVTEMSLAYYQGLQSVGVLACAKHFPGHGDTNVDSHLALPQINKTTEQLYEEELVPFKAAISAKIACIMSGHLSVPALGDSKPASISSKILINLLRKELGFEGVIFSDALNMQAVAKMFPQPGKLELEALKAGNDLLSFSHNIAAGIDLIAEQMSEQRVDESYQRLLQLKRSTCSSDAWRKTDQAYKTPPEEIRKQIASEGITQIKDNHQFDVQKFERLTVLNCYAESGETAFSKALIRETNKHVSTQDFLAYFEDKKASSSVTEEIIICLYVPEIKPHNQFGLEEAVMHKLEILLKQTNACLVIFGNPYALKYIPHTNAHKVLMAYQQMTEFEQQAAAIIAGKAIAKGILPYAI